MTDVSEDQVVAVTNEVVSAQQYAELAAHREQVMAENQMALEEIGHRTNELIATKTRLRQFQGIIESMQKLLAEKDKEIALLKGEPVPGEDGDELAASRAERRRRTREKAPTKKAVAKVAKPDESVVTEKDES